MKTESVHVTKLAVVIALLAAFGGSPSLCTAQCGGDFSNHVAEIIEMPYENYSTSVAALVRQTFTGAETCAVLYAVQNIHSTTDKVAWASSCILRTFEDETYSTFASLLASPTGMPMLLREAMIQWVATVTNVVSLRMVVTNTISDATRVPVRHREFEGDAYRLCDLGYMASLYNIADLPSYLATNRISPLDPIALRDEWVQAFSSWWTSNNAVLYWSTNKGKFSVTQP